MRHHYCPVPSEVEVPEASTGAGCELSWVGADLNAEPGLAGTVATPEDGEWSDECRL